MDHTAIAHSIIEEILTDADSTKTSPRDLWDERGDGYLLEHMPYDVRIGEGRAGNRDHGAEVAVSKIVEALIDSQPVQ